MANDARRHTRAKDARKALSRKIGYARVSTEDQHLDLQLSALKGAGCRRIFEDHGVSGSRRQRPGLEQAMSAMDRGDTLVVWRLDRLGRSLNDLIAIIDELGKRGIEFVSLTESIDTTSAGGRLYFHLMGALAEFERALISERTKAGMREAKRRGITLGRPRILTRQQVDEARRLLKKGGQPLDVLAKRFGVHRDTLLRALNDAGKADDGSE